MSTLQGPQAATTREMRDYHKKKIMDAERALLDDPSDTNYTALKEALLASKRWRESLV